ncbi:MAG: helix-turn-helix domain-containing protein [Anaerovoracaceae bacterium]
MIFNTICAVGKDGGTEIFMFYEKLDAIMLQANIKNKDLAEATGLSQSFISKLRRGVSVPAINSYIYKEIYFALDNILTGAQILQLEHKYMFTWDFETFSSWIYENSSKPLSKFSNCLCLLMDYFNIQNNTLAQNLNIDPSLVSKYRTGKRIPSIGNDIIEKIAVYFSETAIAEKCEKELLSAMNLPAADNIGAAMLSESIISWMTSDSMDNTLMDKIFDIMDDYKSPDMNFNKISALLETYDLPYQDTVKKSGNDGLRDQVLLFLSLCAKSKEKLHLKLFSNQSMDWMIENPDFFEIWKMLMLTILECGHKITIIHNIQRNNTELFSAIEGWTPLHLSGNIESFYYTLPPSKSFSNTIFINCGNFSVYGNTVTGLEIESDYHFTKNRDTVKTLEQAFNDLLLHSKKLLNTTSVKGIDTLIEFTGLDNEHSNSNIYVMHNRLPVWYMDRQLLDEILEDNEVPAEKRAFIISYINKIKKFYVNILRSHKIFEYFYVENRSYSKKQTLDFINVHGYEPVYYSSEHYTRHLKHMVEIIDEFKNYHITVLDRPIHDKIKLFQFENRSIFAVKNKYPVSVIQYENDIILKKFQNYMFAKLKSSINSIDNYNKIISLCIHPFEHK